MRIISFYHNNIPQEIVQAQKSVFDHFELQIEQIETYLTHGAAIDKWLQENEWEEVAIFDIDCIPLDIMFMGFVKLALQLKQKDIIGCFQRANHIPNSSVYLGPFFCCFTKELWEQTARATFVDIPSYDVGGFFSNKAMSIAKNLIGFMPIEVEVPKWDLMNYIKFGNGTTYGLMTHGLIYHAFEIRYNEDSQLRFLNKCKEVINEKK